MKKNKKRTMHQNPLDKLVPHRYYKQDKPEKLEFNGKQC